MAKTPVGHRLVPWRRMPWSVCAKCGLVSLRNEATQLFLRRPCRWDQDKDD